MRYVVVSSVCLAAVSALAQQPSPTEPDPKLEQAKAAFEEGQRYYKVGDYEKALEKYKEAYLLTEAPALLFNIGQCHRKLGHYDEAITAYRNFQKDDPETAQKQGVDTIITELEEQKKNAPPPGQSQPSDPSTVYWGDTDKMLLLGGGLGLGNDFGGAFGSFVGSFGALEAHSKLFIGNGIGLEPGAGLNIASGPRRDHNAKSLYNLSAGVVAPVFFDLDQIINADGIVERSLQVTVGAAAYVSNTFYFTCRFALRVEPQAGVTLFNSLVAGAPPEFFALANVSASYTLKRELCP
jgi:tetratricopeptide (TPR) repeat protein